MFCRLIHPLFFFKNFSPKSQYFFQENANFFENRCIDKIHYILYNKTNKEKRGNGKMKKYKNVKKIKVKTKKKNIEIKIETKDGESIRLSLPNKKYKKKPKINHILCNGKGEGLVSIKDL